MPNLVVGTEVLFPDEACMGLVETDLLDPAYKELRRYRILTVIRGDKPAQFRVDLGPAEKFKAVGEFRIPGGYVDEVTGRIYIEETVGRLCHFADVKHAKPWDNSETQPHDLIGAYERIAKRRRETLKGRR